jgi:hypothetical protein
VHEQFTWLRRLEENPSARESGMQGTEHVAGSSQTVGVLVHLQRLQALILPDFRSSQEFFQWVLRQAPLLSVGKQTSQVTAY